ncbi:MAG: hypothetical protein EZS28_017331 [Streblomastix strix]|uniref:Uncharacterized protein n=1 Tax=Streblomastix strix TaxID=222440 RepID=A0A5J4VX97_9EUKA|nr:MAG: hypothetical protein EZS28_017331 [Streblomastix strix]
MDTKNYIVAEIAANMAGYKAIDAIFIKTINLTANVHLLFLHNEQKYGKFQLLLHQREYEHLKIFFCLTQRISVFNFRKMQELRLALKILAIRTCKQLLVVAIFQKCQ